MSRRKEARTVFAHQKPATLEQAFLILAEREPVTRRLPNLKPNEVALADILPILNNYLIELNITSPEASLLVELINHELGRMPYSDSNRAHLVELKIQLASRYQQRKRRMEHLPTGAEALAVSSPRRLRNPQ